LTRPIVQINTKSDWYGGEYQVLKLLEGLRALGCHTILLANEAGALFRRARDARLPVVALPPLVCRRWFPAGRVVVRRLLADCSPALFHAHDSRALTLTPRSTGRAPVPVVLSRRVPSPFRVSPGSRWRYDTRRLAAIVAVSEAVQHVLVGSGVPESQIHVVPSGTDIRLLDAAMPDRSLAGLAGGRLCIGGVGELTRKKNWAMLIRVASEAKSRGLDLRWFVAGEGPERARLERLARRLGVASEVRLMGFRDDVESYTKGLDILLHTSRAEGTPGAVRMAMLAGVPVVAVKTRGTLEALGGHGLTVGLDDDSGAADAIERLVRDDALRAELAAQASAAARARFDIAAMVAGTVKVYEAVLGGAIECHQIRP
jgi:glycosyltransferase involved in cell wall biosynthesis